MKIDNPDELRRRAYRYQSLAWRINDQQAKQALREMARELKVRANEIAAAIRKESRQT